MQDTIHRGYTFAVTRCHQVAPARPTQSKAWYSNPLRLASVHHPSRAPVRFRHRNPSQPSFRLTCIVCGHLVVSDMHKYSSWCASAGGYSPRQQRQTQTGQGRAQDRAGQARAGSLMCDCLRFGAVTVERLMYAYCTWLCRDGADYAHERPLQSFHRQTDPPLEADGKDSEPEAQVTPLPC